MVILKYLILQIVTLLTLVSCSKNFEAVLKAPNIKSEINVGKPILDGDFQQEDGTIKALSALNDKPLLLFFVSETCSTCREETEHLIAEFTKNGNPTNINVLSVLIGSLPEDISFWRDSFSSAISWELGVDLDLVLYKKYFQVLKTPSVMYFNPQTQILKKWQSAMPIEALKKETVPWN